MNRFKLTPRRLTAAAAVVVVTAAGGIGFGRAAIDTTGPANTAGRAATAYAIGLDGLARLPAFAQSVLVDYGATLATVLATAGSGTDESQLLAVRVAGVTCLTATHGGGHIVEPLNCDNDAYLRVFSDANGSGDVGGAPSASRLLAVVSREVTAVDVTFADGRTTTLKPDGRGVVAVESAARPVSVTAVGADGTKLAGLG